MKSYFIPSLLVLVLTLFGCNDVNKSTMNSNTEASSNEGAKLKALIIDGENNHGVWPKSTMMLKDYLEETEMFDVDINRTAYTWQGGAYNAIEGVEKKEDLIAMYPLEGVTTTIVEKATPDPNYSPDFSSYDLVVSNFGNNASTWTAETKKNFEKYMAEGGGLIVVHAADNSWGDWMEYNKMIGVGGWGGRDATSGRYVYYDQNDKLQYDDSEGNCGGHGPQHEYVMTTRAPEHPIMKGLPMEWMHSKDELYERLRGPAENMTILSTAFSTAGDKPNSKRTERHEPMLSTIEYGKGKIFHSALGHMDYSFECVGFITTFQRAAEWVSTGKVTQEVPTDFPTKTEVKVRKWETK